MLRFATSPTGDMHIDTLRVAILNYLVAQQRKESFIIRIEDTDTERNIEGKDTEIMQILEKFALNHESVFHQSEHLHMHQTLAIRLLEEGKAFVCTCTTEEGEAEHTYSGQCFDVDKTEHAKLKENGTPFVVRIKKPDEAIIYHDLIKGNITSTPDEVDSFVILTTNGIPTHNFASACDDMISGVDFIFHGDEQILNTAKQMHIQRLLGYEAETNYAHLPMILNDKEDDTSTVKWLFAQGFVPDAIINYLILLSNPKAPKKVFTLPEAIKWFKIDAISKSAVVFDLEKLEFINRAHLKRMNDRDLSTLFGFADPDIGKLAKLYLEETSTIKGLIAKLKPIFAAKNFEGKWGTEMRTLEVVVQNAPMINDFESFKTYTMKESKLEGERFSTPLRLLLTGVETGPELADIYPLIKSYLLEVAS